MISMPIAAGWPILAGQICPWNALVSRFSCRFHLHASHGYGLLFARWCLCLRACSNIRLCPYLLIAFFLCALVTHTYLWICVYVYIHTCTARMHTQKRSQLGSCHLVHQHVAHDSSRPLSRHHWPLELLRFFEQDCGKWNFQTWLLREPILLSSLWHGCSVWLCITWHTFLKVVSLHWSVSSNFLMFWQRNTIGVQIWLKELLPRFQGVKHKFLSMQNVTNEVTVTCATSCRPCKTKTVESQSCVLSHTT